MASFAAFSTDYPVAECEMKCMAELGKNKDGHDGKKSLFDDLLENVITPRPGAEPKRVVTKFNPARRERAGNVASPVTAAVIPACESCCRLADDSGCLRSDSALIQAVNEAYSKLLEEAYSTDLSEIDDEATIRPFLAGTGAPDSLSASRRAPPCAASSMTAL